MQMCVYHWLNVWMMTSSWLLSIWRLVPQTFLHTQTYTCWYRLEHSGHIMRMMKLTAAFLAVISLNEQKAFPLPLPLWTTQSQLELKSTIVSWTSHQYISKKEPSLGEFRVCTGSQSGFWFGLWLFFLIDLIVFYFESFLKSGSK